MGPPTNWLLIISYYLDFLVTLATGQPCGAGLTLTYVKVPNMLPRTVYQPTLLFAQAPGVAITATCYNRCRDVPSCDGFIVDYKQGACYRVNMGRQYEEYYHQANVNFFRKVCLKVPIQCAQRAWPVEYVPGYKLLAEQHTVLTNVADKWQCVQTCLNQTTLEGLPCKSSQYQAWSRTCTLSQYDRHTNPESFSITVASDREFEYMENQCPLGKNRGPESPGNEEYCWHDPVYNKTSLRPDLEVDNLTLDECQGRCLTEGTFRCTAYTYQCPVYGNIISRCLLHSDETPARTSSLYPLPCTTYREKISCLDVSVSCSPQSLTVTLQDKMFTGQMFVSGHASQCTAGNIGQGRVQLVIPVPESDYSPNRCNVQVVRSIADHNRTVVSAVVVVQHHNLIQTVNDRVVKVSCYLDSDNMEPPTSQYNNLTLNASFFVKNPEIIQNVISGYGNNTSYPPKAVMRIVDVARGGAIASQAELGDELDLEIFVDSHYNVSMIRAGHLVASSGTGQDTLLLLDRQGCPPDPTTFPALSRLNNSALVARFRAFKFPDSNVLRFSIFLTFCVRVCEPTDCGNGIVSYGKRRKRSTDGEEDVMAEVPLQLEIIVKTSESTKRETSPKPQIAGNVTEDTREERVMERSSELVCASLGTSVMLGAVWLVLQLLLLVGCCWALGQRERQSDRVSLQSDFQPKHVSWGDMTNLTYLKEAKAQPPSVLS